MISCRNVWLYAKGIMCTFSGRAVTRTHRETMEKVPAELIAPMLFRCVCVCVSCSGAGRRVCEWGTRGDVKSHSRNHTHTHTHTQRHWRPVPDTPPSNFASRSLATIHATLNKVSAESCDCKCAPSRSNTTDIRCPKSQY